MCLCVSVSGGSGGGGSNVERTLRLLIMRICIMLYHMPN